MRPGGTTRTRRMHTTTSPRRSRATIWHRRRRRDGATRPSRRPTWTRQRMRVTTTRVSCTAPTAMVGSGHDLHTLPEARPRQGRKQGDDHPPTLLPCMGRRARRADPGLGVGVCESKAAKLARVTRRRDSKGGVGGWGRGNIRVVGRTDGCGRRRSEVDQATQRRA